MTGVLLALAWLIGSLVGLCGYTTVAATLSSLDRPKVADPVPLRLGLTLTTLGLEAGWLTWAALTTGFAQGSPMNMSAVFVGGILTVAGLLTIWTTEDNAFQVFAQVVWPMALMGWLIGNGLIRVCRTGGQTIHGWSVDLADLVDRGERRKAMRLGRIREMEWELGIQDGRLMDLPEIRQGS